MSVICERRPGGVAAIRMSGESLSAADAGRLGAVARELAEDRELRAVLLESAGADFCPGPAADLFAGAVAPPTEPLAGLPCPVIATLTGVTASIGLELALTADFRIAGPSARLSLADAIDHDRLPSWGGTQRLPRIAGRSTATAMLLLGETLTAERSLAVGLVDVVASDPAACAAELVEQLGRRAPLALAYAKEAILQGSELPMRSAILLEADLNLLLRTSRDRARGLQAFFDRRAPEFGGD